MQFDMDRDLGTEKHSSGFTFPELYRSWLDYDVDYCDLWLFRGLTPSDLYLYWDALERKCLDRYRGFLRLEHEFSCSGLVSIQYPGAVSSSPYVFVAEVLSIPPSLDRDLRGWCNFVEKLVLEGGTAAERDLEYPWGLAIAKDLVKYVPEDMYFEFRALQQIGIRNDVGVVLGCDPEINEILNLYPAGIFERT